MAITRSQIAKQLLQQGGRAGFQEGGGIEQRLEKLGGDVTSAEKLLQGINQRLKTAESSLGSGGGQPTQLPAGGLGSLTPSVQTPNPFFGENPFKDPLTGGGQPFMGNMNPSSADPLTERLDGGLKVPEGIIPTDTSAFKNISTNALAQPRPGSLIPLEENPTFLNIPEQFRSGFANYLKENPNSFGFGGQMMSSVGLPGGGSVTFGDTGSAGAFRNI